MGDNTENCKIDNESALSGFADWKPSDYDVRQISLNFASNLLNFEGLTDKQKLTHLLSTSKIIEDYLKSGEIRVIYEKSV